jgi:hypothetical protein
MASDLVSLVQGHRWIPLAALVIHGLTRALKSDRVPAPLDRIPPAARPGVALGLGALAGVLDHVTGGTPWGTALLAGLLAAALAMSGHDVGIEWLRGGREIGLPPDEPPPTPRDPSVPRPGGGS